MIAGGFDDINEEGSYKLANMKAVSNAEIEFAMGHEPTEISRLATTTRSGFIESEGTGIDIIVTARTALEIGAPTHEPKLTVCGDAHWRGDPSFLDYSRTFNGDVRVPASAVVCSPNAPDISQVILLCRKHSLYAYVKAGGYGKAGWAVEGDVIIDLCKITDIDIEPPAANGSFTSIRDMPLLPSKGKVKAGPPLLDQSAIFYCHGFSHLGF
ncbi:hypothetical protein EDB19DRAFT_1918466 [Suillus lakei]|nr:hypothetical protein EDB19DRAFT_1918466 [Suillus lakei]